MKPEYLMLTIQILFILYLYY